MPVMGITLYGLYTLENLLQKRAYYDHIFRQRLFNSGSSHDLEIAAYVEFFMTTTTNSRFLFILVCLANTSE